MNPDPSNTIFQKAVAFVNQTSKHLFLTGKAGTGKTTFLKYIKQNTFKRMAVVAPTGVAAINAGGVTIHSFFQLPLGPYIPAQNHYYGNYTGEVNNPATLIKNLRLSSVKREVIRELDLLIIDEISMVRADLLDAMDTVMRHVRRQPLIPFGGVQVVYIGDLYQLPPVTKNNEWNLLKDYYASPFFFSAQVMQFAFPIYIELKKIYRQKDEAFISVLNNVRNNCCTEADLTLLHKYYKPGYSPEASENYITLTSHNGKADAMNQAELEKLPGKQLAYKATISGEFNERSYPAESILYLKKGAQIMFIKNDKGDFRRYYNGKIGTICKLEEEKIFVRFADEPGELELLNETWKNIRYKYVQGKDQVEEEELGTFTQYPIRLAWAITIHKSQGLTFEKAIIDAGASFAPGQVYVSLSRLTTLEGLVLYSRILPHTISTDERVVAFVKNEKAEDYLQQTLEAEQKIFVQQSLTNCFTWETLVEVMSNHYDAYEHRNIPNKNVSIEWGLKLLNEVNAQCDIAQKFKRTLSQIFVSCVADGYTQLLERVGAACGYFVKEIDEKLLEPLSIHVTNINAGGKVKKYVKELHNLKMMIERKKLQLQQALQLAEALHQSSSLQQLLTMVEEQHRPLITVNEPTTATVIKDKPSVGDSHRLTLQLFKQGKPAAAIAAERNLALSTIEGHLVRFVKTGEIDILDLVDAGKLDEILAVIKNQEINPQPLQGALTYTAIKEKVAAEITYAEIRAVLNFVEWEQSLEKEGIKE